jgi:uncharacterized protein (DUF885 family)
MQALKSLLFCILLLLAPSAMAEEQEPDAALQALAARFFEWRRVQQPVTGDDIPRIERPDQWVPDFSPEALDVYRERYLLFLQAVDKLLELHEVGWSIANQVDARLLKAAIERVHWELDVLQLPQRNPLFYVDQTLGSIFELLVLSTPITASRAENILLRMEHFPVTLKAARKNLEDQAVRPFAAAAIETLEGIDERLLAMQAALKNEFPAELEKRLESSTRSAIRALEKYRKWLQSELDEMQPAFAIGPHEYQWFLSHVALIPYTPDELLAQGQQAWSRSVAWDVIEKNRNRDLPEMPLFKSADHQIKAAALKENEIRAFLESRNLMTVPRWLQHYRNREMPDYLKPLSFMGVNDDLTSENRLDEDAYSYIPEPAADLSYFRLASARDPRPLIIHEGVPGHYFQLALSWANPDPIRRRYIDSGANEGIGFYVEEMLLQAGLFDYSPGTREIIYSFMRLRALRVEIDIRLAVGDFTIEQAGDYLARAVPMDRETAIAEAVFFAFNPGQAISYQIGKLQILQFLADAKLDQGEDFSLRHFHDFLMENGNVPIALQRWQYLGRINEVLRLEVLGGTPVTVPQ